MICSLINREYDLFPFTIDIQAIVSSHVECVVMMTKVNNKVCQSF